MQDTATAMLNAPSVQHGFDRMFQALSTASITNGAQVAVVLYYDPVSTAAGCVDARAIAETLINTVDAELLRRAQAAGLPTVDLRPVFSGHEMGTANAYVFGTTCDLADGALVHLPNWLPSITALKSQFDPHPNSTGTAAMADAILGTVGP
jgi:hypothetical protein